MPKMDEAEVVGFLDEPGHLVRIANVDADGCPRVVPTWFVRQGDDIVFTPRGPAVFLANIRRDPRIALTVDEDALPYRKVTVQGTARVAARAGQRRRVARPLPVIAKRYIPDEQADDYIQNTIDQPRALIGVLDGRRPDDDVAHARRRRGPHGHLGPPVLRRRHDHGRPRRPAPRQLTRVRCRRERELASDR